MTRAEVEELLANLPRSDTYTKAEVDELMAKKQDKPATPTPPTTPPTTTPYISELADLTWMNWRPDQGGGGVIEGSHFKRITAPSGPGFEINCSDANQAAWNSSNKAVLAVKDKVTTLGQTQDWSWDMFLPTQTISVDQYVLWQWHTNSSSGHNIGLNRDGTYRLTRQSAYGQVYDRNYSSGPPIIFDRWHPCRIQVKWSLGGDGFLRMWIDNKLVKSFDGATQFQNDGTPYLQFGWYGIRPSGVVNTVRFANIQRIVS
jgi:hypothetical protein